LVGESFVKSVNANACTHHRGERPRPVWCLN
jgi:hypothetical protein